MKKYLTLADGHQWVGTSFGANNQISGGQLVFNTGMTGYQETITDPSYTNQLIAFTSPLIGNYGVDSQVSQAKHVGAQGIIVHELADFQQHYASEQSLASFLSDQNVVGISGIDTRELTRHLRETGQQAALISNTPINDFQTSWQQLPKPKHYHSQPQLCPAANATAPHVVLLDFGEKTAIQQQLVAAGCRVTVVDPKITWSQLKQLHPSGVLLSNGPGNPTDYSAVLPLIRQIQQQLPLVGICLGHQLLALANGAKTYQLKFGHHGLNHPVQALTNRHALITAQNHDYAVGLASLKATPLEATYVELNDHSVEGLQLPGHPVFSVQFHPEANPGPHDASGFFKHFVTLMQPEVLANA